MSTFGAAVRARRLELGMTLQEVADYAGTTKSYVWELENRGKNVGLALAVKVAACLTTNVYGLLGVATPRR